MISTNVLRAIVGVIAAPEADLSPAQPVCARSIGQQPRDHMVPHVDHRDRFDAVLRANRIMILGVLWCALVTCAISSLVYDVGHWLSAW